MTLHSDLLQHKPFKEVIFEVLHQRILTGVYSSGEWLRQEEIASQMGVSMTPVREALDLLAASGLAERVPYRGVRVVELSPRDIVEAYGMRLLLECFSVRQAAVRISSSELQHLENLLIGMDDCSCTKDLSRSRQLNREFHFSIVQAAANSLLLRMYTNVSNAFPDWMLYEAVFHHPELLAESLVEENSEHRALLAALKDHDQDGAVRRAIDHILHIGRQLELHLNIPAQDLRHQEQGIIPLLLPTRKEMP